MDSNQESMVRADPPTDRGEMVIENATVVTMDSEIGVLRDHSIHVVEGLIAAIAPRVSAPSAQRIDATGMIALPGFVDTHQHMWSSIAKNFVSEGFGYSEAKRATARCYEPEDVHASVMLGALENLAAGITTVHNWAHNLRSAEHADAEVAALRASGTRARFSYGHRDMLPVDEPLDFAAVSSLKERWDDLVGTRDLLRLGVNLRGPDLGEDLVFEREMAQARALALPVAIHTLQDPSTRVRARRLLDLGYLGPDLLICHFLNATDEDARLLADSGTPVSFSPHSEFRLGFDGDPRAAMLRFLRAGVRLSISIDATSIAPVDMFQSMNLLWNTVVPWASTDDPSTKPLSYQTCLHMATLGGAVALGIDDVVGSLTPGKRADVLLVRTTDLNMAPLGEPQSMLVKSARPDNIDTVLVDGVVKKRGGSLVGQDLDAAISAAVMSARAVRQRAGLPAI